MKEGWKAGCRAPPLTASCSLAVPFVNLSLSWLPASDRGSGTSRGCRLSQSPSREPAMCSPSRRKSPFKGRVQRSQPQYLSLAPGTSPTSTSARGSCTRALPRATSSKPPPECCCRMLRSLSFRGKSRCHGINAPGRWISLTLAIAFPSPPSARTSTLSVPEVPKTVPAPAIAFAVPRAGCSGSCP